MEQHVAEAVRSAFENKSKLSPGALGLPGMSGDKSRHLYNNICALDGATYLEVGTYMGSSFISALYGNTIRGYCIDNWSEFAGKDEFLDNVKRYLPADADYKMIDKDCWTVTQEDVPDPIDIYLYDGAHNYEDQKRAITHFYPFFADQVTILVDDWTCDWVGVKQGTLDGIKETGLKVLYSKEIGLVGTKRHHCGGDTFWNGCGIFVCQK
jgi:hypothetical protein